MYDDDEVSRIVSATTPLRRMDSTSGALSMNTVEYLSLPMQEFMEEEDQMNYKNQSSSKLLNRIVSGGVVLSLIGAIIVAGFFYKNQTRKHSHSVIVTDDDPPLPVETCYLAPSCQNYGQYAPLVYSPQGWTNLTGWESRNAFDGCCDICVSVTPTAAPTTTPLSAASSPSSSSSSSAASIESAIPGAKYDYLMLDLMWLPQFCRGLAQGHDITLSHPAGTQCVPSIFNNPPRLSIHGLWPNKYDSSVLCCVDEGKTTVPVLDPVQVQSWGIWNGLKYYWFDPTVNTVLSGNTCSVCYLLNHEWQKHGSCFASTAARSSSSSLSSSSSSLRVDTDSNEFRYFQAGLLLRDIVGEETDAVSSFAGSVIPTERIASLFPKKVNVICDPQDSFPADPAVKVFSELQICWTGSSPATYEMMDCPPPYESNFQTACPEVVFVPNYDS